MTIQKMTGRQAFIKLLLDEGVTHLFGNPGTTELAIMEAVPQFPELTYVLGLQESIVVGMADGFARASNQLVACNLHCAPGLGHAMGAIYNAKFSGSPLLITAGQYEVGYGLQEPLLYEPLVPMAAPLVKWAFEVTRIEDLPRVIRRAAKIARTPPMGPVFISLPGSVLDEEAEIEFGFPTLVDTGMRPSDRALQDIAEKLLAAKKPVIVAGREIANADMFAEACELAELLGAAVYQESVPYNSRYPSSHPTCMGDLTRNQKKVRQTLEQYDFLLCLGADLLRMSPMSTVEPLPPEMPVMHITEREWELGKNYSTATAVRADVKETLLALLPLLRSMRTAKQAKQAQARLADLATRNWSANRAKMHAELESSASTTPIDQRYLVRQIVDALPKDVIVVDETLTASPAISALLPMDDPQAYYGLASGGLGFGMAGAVGVALAQPTRPVVATIGDGSAMYSIQSLWTAAHLKLNITYVIINNRSYRIIKERLLAMRGTDDFVAMDIDNPAIDFAGLAKSMGMPSQVVTDPTKLADVLKAAMASGGPNLVEVIVSRGFGE
ncbi:IlvB Thiamine pyrophosphate-requiring enzymes [acetolactate synthase, pyruvate dehydrogenase (cytochrome), glyoxylate carboligase, phosphonopyruvate decarboxylase] [Burkholderiaceae bacterium]